MSRAPYFLHLFPVHVQLHENSIYSFNISIIPVVNPTKKGQECVTVPVLCVCGLKFFSPVGGTNSYIKHYLLKTTIKTFAG